MRPLVVDEGMDLDDLVFTLVDDETGQEYCYNPQGMDYVFGPSNGLDK